MLVRVPALLDKTQVAHFRSRLEGLAWVDGRATAGEQSALAKRNLQVPEDAPEARELGQAILTALGQSETFVSAALPLRVFPPLFNRYDAGMTFKAHIDNAIRFTPQGVRVRTDIACTLFLSDPADYDGGELVIEDTYGEQKIKFDAGDLVVYPAASLHRVEPVARGSRWASFFWAQSMVRDEGQRRLLYELDGAIRQVRGSLSDEDRAAVTLTGVYHNLLRRWAEA
ncbi:MAG TPA: Fe2+-dependent dioxygenase [Caulobacteraceae bacterium]|jgi:PKHD-type hydroxylase|nr:Fe2+-dependent dioxygenase [Caulobacteraceae bacterium]